MNASLLVGYSRCSHTLLFSHYFTTETFYSPFSLIKFNTSNIYIYIRIVVKQMYNIYKYKFTISFNIFLYNCLLFV